MKNKLKVALVGKEFKEDDYNEKLNNILKKFKVEANTCDFDCDRIYNAKYEGKENWEDEYICSLETEFITKNNGENFIKINDVY